MEESPDRNIPLLDGEFSADVQGKLYRVTLLSSSSALVGAVEHNFDLTQTGEKSFSLILNSKTFTINVDTSPQDYGSNGVNAGGLTLSVNDKILRIVVDDRRSLLRKSLFRTNGQSEKSQTIRAPMPGLVVRLEVEEQDQFETGNGLVILEAMKMENEIRATAPGSVEKIFVRPGAVVEKGEPLLSINYH